MKLFLILQHPLPSDQILTFATFADPFDPRLIFYFTLTPSKNVSHLHSLFLATVNDEHMHTFQDLARKDHLVSEVKRKIVEVTSSSNRQSESVKTTRRGVEAEKPMVQNVFKVSMKQDGKRV